MAGSIGGFTVAGFTANGAVKLKIMVKGTAGAGVVTAATIKLGVNAAIKADASLQAYVDVDQVVDAQGNVGAMQKVRHSPGGRGSEKTAILR